MGSSRRRRGGGKRRGRGVLIAKPNGVLHPRVQQVGPEHFGIVTVDPAKARSTWMLADFYGRVLVEPTVVAHNNGDLKAMVQRVRQAAADHDLRDLVVGIERCGRYHQPAQRAFRVGGVETRIVHPYCTKHFRQPADPGDKTDPTDLAGMHRAVVNGFGLLEPEPEPLWRRLKLLVRHRRDLVEKASLLRCQIREHLESVLPGYGALFEDLWGNRVALPAARRFGSADAIARAGVAGLAAGLKEAGLRFQTRTLERVVAWSHTAAASDPDADLHQRVWMALEEDRRAKQREIQGLEGEVAGLLVQTPYVLLLSFPAINVVSAADLAGEMGPIQWYANARRITGRAGLYPSRAQSDQVDHADGPLVRCANRALRAALMRIAANLIKCNRYFNARAALWRKAGKDPCHIHVRVASTFSRIAYQMVAGRRVFQHRSTQQRHYVLDKLLAFHGEHGTPPDGLRADLEAAAAQLPRAARAEEAQPLKEALTKTQTARRRGPQPLAEILPLVLAKLSPDSVQCNASGS